MVLQGDVALGLDAKALHVLELALGDHAGPAFVVDAGFDDLLTVEIVREHAVADADAGVVPLAGFDLGLALRGDHVVQRAHAVGRGQAVFVLGVVENLELGARHPRVLERFVHAIHDARVRAGGALEVQRQFEVLPVALGHDVSAAAARDDAEGAVFDLPALLGEAVLLVRAEVVAALPVKKHDPARGFLGGGQRGLGESHGGGKGDNASGKREVGSHRAG